VDLCDPQMLVYRRLIVLNRHAIERLADAADQDFDVAAAQLDGDRCVRVFLRRDVVERIGVEWAYVEKVTGKSELSALRRR
jgi:hypothetical protein